MPHGAQAIKDYCKNIREMLEKEGLVETMRRQEVEAKTRVTEEDLQRYYEANREKFVIPERIREAFQQGTDFFPLARMYTSGSTKNASSEPDPSRESGRAGGTKHGFNRCVSRQRLRSISQVSVVFLVKNMLYKGRGKVRVPQRRLSLRLKLVLAIVVSQLIVVSFFAYPVIRGRYRIIEELMKEAVLSSVQGLEHDFVEAISQADHKTLEEHMSLEGKSRPSLEKGGWNQSQATRLLAISRDTLRYRMKRFGFLD